MDMFFFVFKEIDLFLDRWSGPRSEEQKHVTYL